MTIDHDKRKEILQAMEKRSNYSRLTPAQKKIYWENYKTLLEVAVDIPIKGSSGFMKREL
jgi:hypothetical protein